MVELIMVIVLMGILGAVGVTRYFDRKTFDASEFIDQAKSMLRYAQKTAVAQNRPVYVRLNGASVALCFDAACNTRVLPAAGTNSGNSLTLAACNNATAWACESKPANITYVLAPSATTSFFFDPQGKPFSVGDTYPGLTSSFATLTMTISGDGSSRTITVEQETGYVH